MTTTWLALKLFSSTINKILQQVFAGFKVSNSEQRDDNALDIKNQLPWFGDNYEPEAIQTRLQTTYEIDSTKTNSGTCNAIPCTSNRATNAREQLSAIHSYGESHTSLIMYKIVYYTSNSSMGIGTKCCKYWDAIRMQMQLIELEIIFSHWSCVCGGPRSFTGIPSDQTCRAFPDVFRHWLVLHREWRYLIL